MAKKFLYVSNEDSCEALDYLRNEMRCQFDTANNRHEAFEHLRTGDYSGVVMTDLALDPGVLEEGETWSNKRRNVYQNGLRVVNAVKRRRLPLIIFTASDEEYLQEARREIGPDRVFRKVLEYEQFLAAVRKMCAA